MGVDHIFSPFMMIWQVVNLMVNSRVFLASVRNWYTFLESAHEHNKLRCIMTSFLHQPLASEIHAPASPGLAQLRCITPFL